MKTLYLIPARGGSKGIPGKNIKLLGGKPLINYSIDAARSMTTDLDICVSTDSDEIISIAERYGLKVPFKRPQEISSDNVGTYDVIIHALNYYENNGVYYDNVMLLQPTSPFRIEQHLIDVLGLYSDEIDMVVSVGLSHQNPYFTLFEDNEEGYLEKSKKGYFQTRQEAPPVYFYNGSLYLINTNSLRINPMHQFQKIKKYVMDDIYSIDIDTPLDWANCETMLNSGYIK